MRKTNYHKENEDLAQAPSQDLAIVLHTAELNKEILSFWKAISK